LLVHRIRQAGFDPQPLRVDTPEAMKAALADHSWDVVLCDHVMPDFSGPAALELLKQSGLDLPFIVVSSKVGEETALPMLMAGAHDFVDKGGLTRLLPAIEREVRQARIRHEHRIAEAKFRALIENVTDLVAVIDKDAAISYISPSVTRLGGYLPDEVTGRKYLEFVHPEDLEQARGVLSAILTHPGEIQKNETRFRHKDGHWVTLEAVSRNVLGDPAVRGVIVNARDVTERKRAEDSIRESRDLLRAVVDNAPLRVFWKDRDSRYLGCNASFARSAGFAHPNDLVGKSDLQLAWRDQAERYRAEDDQVMASGVPKLGIEEQRTTPSGRRIWVSSSIIPLRDAGKVFGVVGIQEDITTRKKAEGALERSNRALRTLSAGNTSLVRATDEPALLAQMCRVIVAEGGYRAAVVVYRRDDPEKTVEPLASFGVELSQVRPLSITWGEDEHGEGAIPRAIRSGAAQLVRNAQSDPVQRARWQNPLAITGPWSALALPLRLDAEAPFGALYIVAAGDEAFDENETPLLLELASDLAFGVSVLRTRAAREEATRKLQIGLERTVEAIAATLERRDPYTAGHERGVADLAVAIGREMELPDAVCEGIHFGALIHDLGKIQVPAEILSKPSRLSRVEYELVKAHPEVGYDIVKGIDFPWPIAQMVLQHHERLDGSGYPRGLRGEEIIVEARILAVADVVEAMASHRPYRPGFGFEKALAEIEANRGRLYDARAVDACLRLFRDKNYRLPK
jgi:PAS domain S-box-containing protein